MNRVCLIFGLYTGPNAAIPASQYAETPVDPCLLWNGCSLHHDRSDAKHCDWAR